MQSSYPQFRISRGFVIFAMLLLLCPTLWGGAEPARKPKGTWLVVTRPMFVGAIKPLADKRRREGFRVVVSTKSPPKAIAAAGAKVSFILLVGDDQQGHTNKPWYLPARRLKGYYWRGRRERTFASDSIYGDLDGDNVPDVPVGRIPARTVAQAKLVVSKILTYEAKPPTLADLGMAFWAGAPMYGELIDSMATGMALVFLEANAPRWLSPWVLTADRKHPLCGWPADQPARFTRQLTTGGAIAILMGHGDTESFYSMRHRGGAIIYNAATTGGMLDRGDATAPMLVFTCSSGDFTAPEMCMTESLLFLPAGPVAIVGATDESHPLPNYYSGLAALKVLHDRPRRIGTLWLDSQRRGLKASDFIAERVLRHVEGKIGMDSDIAQLKRDQPLLYALLGDPATTLRLPFELHGNIKLRGDKWHWQINKPKGATRLYVGLRASGGASMSRLAQPLGKPEARKAAQIANATFAFKPLAELKSDVEWRGQVAKEGTLRLVAVGPGKLYAVAITLKRPEKAASGGK